MNLRQTLRARRKALSRRDRQLKSAAIARNLSRYSPFQRASRVAFYMSTEEEVDTSPAIDYAHELGKTIYLPVINRASWRKTPLLFQPYEPGKTRLVKNKYGILEPAHLKGTPVRAVAIDLICVPLVGFNSSCDRIGMGAGYYDRSLANPAYRRTTLAGLAFACQQAEFEPEPHDVPMNAIVTENKTYRRG